jgi:hypothetical protein
VPVKTGAWASEIEFRNQEAMARPASGIVIGCLKIIFLPDPILEILGTLHEVVLGDK